MQKAKECLVASETRIATSFHTLNKPMWILLSHLLSLLRRETNP